MTLTRRKFLFVLLGLLAACDVTEGEPDYTIAIRRDGTFEPSSLTIPRGSIVAWHNRGDSVHTVTTDPAKAQLPARVVLPENATPFDSGDLFSGERWAYRFDVPGTYMYFCRYHELDEMIGVITVNN